MPVRKVFAYALAFGLASGFLEAIARSLLPWSPPEDIRLGTYLAWMPAAANGAWFLAAAALLSPAVALAPRLPWTRLVVQGFGTLACFNVLMLATPTLAWWAILILSIGLAAALGRLVQHDPARTDRITRWSVGPMLAATVLVAVGIEVGRSRHERSSLAVAPPVGGSPNVLLLVMDNVRAWNTSAYGYFRPTTPALEALARRGARFEAAHSTSSWSLPSHASILTGRWVHELNAGGVENADWRTPLDDRYPTLAEVLTRRGYTTAGFVANLAYAQREAGLSRGFGYYSDYLLSVRQVLMSSQIGARAVTVWHNNVRPLPGPSMPHYHRSSAADINARLLRWVDARRGGGRPFFAFVNYFDAHVGYYAPREFLPFARDTVPAQGDTPSVRIPFTPAASNPGYDRAIAYIDRELGRLFGELNSRGLLDSTVVIVTSDHGEEFREHQIFGHGNTLYLPALRVPLILSYPARVPAGAVVHQAVSLRDLPATVLDLTGDTAGTGIPGRSLARHWSAAGALAEDTLFAELNRGINSPPRFPVSRGDMKSVLVDGLHLILNGDGVIELYDTRADPWEQRDLAGESAHANDVRQLGELLRALPSPHARGP